MTTAERRAKLTRLRDQVDDLKDSIHVLYADAEAGSELESWLERARLNAIELKTSLGFARDKADK